MATTEPLWTEAKLALTEKKMDMSLDDIIKMSKVPTKGKKQQHRTWNKTRNFAKRGGAEDKPAKARHYVDTRSAMRQDVLTQRRSNFHGNHQFPIAARNTRAFKRKPRAGAPFAQRRAGNNSNAGFFGNKLPQQQHHQKMQPQQLRQQENAAPKQRPQTLDTLLANIKEQRMKRAQPRHNNAAAPRSRGGRFGN